MVIRTLSILLGCVFAQVHPLAAPIEAYARLPKYENVTLSPDGKSLAFVTTVGEEREVVIQSADESGPPAEGDRVKAGQQKFRHIYWVGNQQLVVFSSQSTDYLFGVQYELANLNTYDLKRKSAVSPFEWRREVYVYGIFGSPQPRIVNDKPYLYTPGRVFWPGGDHALIQSDLVKRINKVVDTAPLQDVTKSYRWTIDQHGTPVVLSGYNEETQSWMLYTKKQGAWRLAHSEKAAVEIPLVLGLGVEEGTVLVHKVQDGKWVIQPFTYTDETWGEPFATEHCCVDELIEDPTTHRSIGYSWIDHRRHYHFWNSAVQQRWRDVQKSFPGEELRLESWTSDLQKAVIQVFGKTSGAIYVLADLQNKKIYRLGNMYQGIEPEDIAGVSAVTFDAHDGLKIPAYITLPNHRTLKNLPLIVMPHGGPAARDSLVFDWLAQALAEKGYVVLQPNFRGSHNVSRALYEAGWGEYGRKMQTDLSDGARALIKLGTVDPKRVCVLGASYGGYAALLGAATESEFYRCAISIAGISDLRKQLSQDFESQKSKESPRFRHIMRYIGVDSIESAVVAERSPVKLVEHIKAPVLLLHGDQDGVVQFEQSKIMADAMKKAGKPHQLIRLKSEDHWLSKSATRLQTLQEIVKFLDVHNPP